MIDKLLQPVRNIMAIMAGMGTTIKHIFQRPVTIQYPEKQRQPRQRFKGRHALKRYDNGLEKCIGCSLCAAACPADAIWVEAEENKDGMRFSPGERYAKTYEINMLRCIFCGYCEDACPTEAIVLEHNIELSFYDRESALYTKEMLIDPPGPDAKFDTPVRVPDAELEDDLGIDPHRSIPEMQDPY